MKALLSIAFNEFNGSAGDVTARVSKATVSSGKEVIRRYLRYSTPQLFIEINESAAVYCL